MVDQDEDVDELDVGLTQAELDARVVSFLATNTDDKDNNDDEEVDQENNDEEEEVEEEEEEDELLAKIKWKMNDECKCKNRNHYIGLSAEEEFFTILDLREKDNDEFDLYIKGCVTRKQRKPTSTIPRYRYTVQSHDVCREVFFTFNDLGHTKFENIMKHKKEEGLSAREHGNTGRQPMHTSTFEQCSQALSFIKEYANCNGAPQPAASRASEGQPPILLPAGENKKIVYEVLRKPYMNFMDCWM